MTFTANYVLIRTKAERSLPRIALALLGATAAIALLAPEARSQTVTQPITVTAAPEPEAIPAHSVEEMQDGRAVYVGVELRW